jgi:ATP-dependent Lon protease
MSKDMLHIFYLKKKVLFPSCNFNVTVKKNANTAELTEGDSILIYPIRSIFNVMFHKNRLATEGKILSRSESDHDVSLQIRGLHRVRITGISNLQRATFTPLPEEDIRTVHHDELRKKTQELIFLIDVKESETLISMLNYFTNFSRAIDFIANYFILDFSRRMKIYNVVEIEKRGELLISMIDNLIKSVSRQKRKDYEKNTARH